MPVTEEAPVSGAALASWVAERLDTGQSAVPRSSLRFAFYGRVSTEDHQDPETSRGWQLLNAQALTSGHGRIVVEFFDVGHSRVLPWTRRPDAAALATALAHPNRGFDVIVIGSSERAFYGQQFASMAPLFAHYGISVWLPELGGEVDPEIAAHGELMVLLGIIAKREVVRARMRGADLDDHPGSRPGPLPRRPTALRIPARRRRAPPQPGLGPPRRPRPTPGHRPDARPRRHLDVPTAPRRPQHGPHHPRTQRHEDPPARPPPTANATRIGPPRHGRSPRCTPC